MLDSRLHTASEIEAIIQKHKDAMPSMTDVKAMQTWQDSYKAMLERLKDARKREK